MACPSSSPLAQTPKVPTGCWTLCEQSGCFSLKRIRSDFQMGRGLQRVFLVAPVLVMLTTGKNRVGPGPALLRISFLPWQRSLCAVHGLSSSWPCSRLHSVFRRLGWAGGGQVRELPPATHAPWAPWGACKGFTSWKEDGTVLAHCDLWLELAKEQRRGGQTRKTFYFGIK